MHATPIITHQSSGKDYLPQIISQLSELQNAVHAITNVAGAARYEIHCYCLRETLEAEHTALYVALATARRRWVVPLHQGQRIIGEPELAHVIEFAEQVGADAVYTERDGMFSLFAARSESRVIAAPHGAAVLARKVLYTDIVSIEGASAPFSGQSAPNAELIAHHAQRALWLAGAVPPELWRAPESPPVVALFEGNATAARWRRFPVERAEPCAVSR